MRLRPEVTYKRPQSAKPAPEAVITQTSVAEVVTPVEGDYTAPRVIIGDLDPVRARSG